MAAFFVLIRGKSDQPASDLGAVSALPRHSGYGYIRTAGAHD